MESILRCKMRVLTVTQSMSSSGAVEQEMVELQAVHGGSEENKKWAAATPSANFKIWISNPAAFGQLSKGHEYYVDFTPASENKQEGN